MKWGIVRFPGSNCDQDLYHVIRYILGQKATYLWHKDTDLQNCDIIALPGGFSYGDYLRCGAIARFSPIMQEVLAHASRGGPIIGICNGFQVLCESQLLPGALIRNRTLHFVCQHVHLLGEGPALKQTKLYVPIAHGEGCYYNSPDGLKKLEYENQILLRYCSPQGTITEEDNPNGSLNNIAAICSPNRRIWGMMPHPERACEAALGSTDGLTLFRCFLQQISTA